MTYEELEDRLGEVVVRHSQQMPDGDQHRLVLLRVSEDKYATFEYQTLGFPPPNDPDNEDRWLRDARQQVEGNTVSMREAVIDLRCGYYEDVWGGAGAHFVNLCLEKLDV